MQWKYADDDSGIQLRTVSRHSVGFGCTSDKTCFVAVLFCFRFFSSVFLCLWVVVRVYVMCVGFCCCFYGGWGGLFLFFICYIFKPLNICAKYNMLLCDK